MTVHPGLEPVLVQELASLGLDAEPTEGGAVLPASWEMLQTVCRGSRVAGGVRVRVARVQAGSLGALAHGVRSAPWSAFLHRHQPVEVKVSTRGAVLRRKPAVRKKVEHALADALRKPGRGGGPPVRDPAVVHVRLVGDRAQLSVDAVGERMHRRGWRKRTAKAPIRENLAAAILHLAGWRPGIPLVDPMCGAGTFVIEAARWSRGFGPRLPTEDAWERWPVAPRRPWKAEGQGTAPRALLWGSDRNEGGVRAARANARDGRVSPDVRLEVSSFEDLPVPPGPAGLLVANPPYGERLGGGRDPGGLYRRFGEVIAARWSGWRLAWVVPSSASPTWLAPDLEEVAHFSNGGIPVKVVLGDLP